MSESPKQLPNCLNIAEASVVLVVLMVTSMTSEIILLLFLIVAQHESDTRKTISLAVTIYRKNSPSQCNLTVQIGPVQGTNFSFQF